MLVFEPDLMFSSRVESAAAKFGLQTKVTVAIDELQTAILESLPKALLVNLDLFPDVDSSFVASVHERCRMIGYYSHVDSKLAARALANGFDQIMPRRTFMEKLSEILADLSSS